MDEKTIGLKRVPYINRVKWIPCPDYETSSEKQNWIQKLFNSDTDRHRCIHTDICANYEYSELYNECAAGYWHYYEESTEKDGYPNVFPVDINKHEKLKEKLISVRLLR